MESASLLSVELPYVLAGGTKLALSVDQLLLWRDSCLSDVLDELIWLLSVGEHVD